MITDELIAALSIGLEAQSVADVRIGLGYTAALLEDGHAGVAYTFREKASAGCSVFMGKRPLSGRNAVELLDYLGSSQEVESTVGLAVANALGNRPTLDQEEGDILEFLDVRPEDRVGMVGYFGPLVGPLEQQAAELVIFERNASRSSKVLPAEQALERLPGCNVAVITSTSLILGDLDDLLEAAAYCREVALVGASTPLVPGVFAARGVTLLAGVVVTDPPAVLRIVSEGGGMGFFGSSVRKVNIRTEKGSSQGSPS
jgi:uncharacterized protein (DUF4213/DUF364 family)